MDRELVNTAEIVEALERLALEIERVDRDSWVRDHELRNGQGVIVEWIEARPRLPAREYGG